MATLGITEECTSGDRDVQTAPRFMEDIDEEDEGDYEPAEKETVAAAEDDDDEDAEGEQPAKKKKKSE
ncbi:hypothetical protein BIW11_02318 [Tropilaelaps mercedesae]|uniref:Uncharacterized protein n=1 Tax=Tropilaelaps mercedesae TaxID=418985 RepID=A0A1V9WZT4_9ACAR|nr:hypothetical protein BIW11_02318 [Tropilaelaps mercedesae]